MLPYLVFLPVLAEGGVFLVARFPATRKMLFSRGEAFVAQLSDRKDVYWAFVADRYDGVLGWDTPRGRTGAFPGCGRGPVTATYLEDGSRRTTAINTGPSILAFGDSFTRGDGVEDEERYPAQLSRAVREAEAQLRGAGP